jgi:hypothetical protein
VAFLRCRVRPCCACRVWRWRWFAGALQGSLFGDQEACGWNLNHLDTFLQRTVGAMPGITRAMLYFGSWRAMFAFHKEVRASSPPFTPPRLPRLALPV